MHRELYRDHTMENENEEEIEEALPSEAMNEEETIETVSTEQDPLKTELEKIQKTQGRSKREKLLFTKKRVEEQLAELGEESELDEEDRPVTVGMLKKMQTQSATKTALQLADEIQNETERELAKYHIENTIRPTGDAQKDLDLALIHVNHTKNTQIVTEIKRKVVPKKHSPSGGANPQDGKVEEVFTAQEMSFMGPPFNLTREDILKSRKK